MERELSSEELLTRAQIAKVGIALLEESIENEAAVLLEENLPPDPLKFRVMVSRIRETNRPRLTQREQLEEESDDLALRFFTQQLLQTHTPDQVREKYIGYPLAWQEILEGIKEGTIPPNYLENPVVLQYKAHAERSELAMELFERGNQLFEVRNIQVPKEPTPEPEKLKVIKLKKAQDGRWQSRIGDETAGFLTDQDCSIIYLFTDREGYLTLDRATTLIREIVPQERKASGQFRNVNNKFVSHGHSDIRIVFEKERNRNDGRWVIKGATVEIEEEREIGEKNNDQPEVGSRISPAYS